MEIIQYIDQVDKQLMITLNGLNAPWLDQIWWMISYAPVWIPLYVAILVAAIHRYGKSRKLLWLILTFAVAVLLSNTIVNELLKPTVARFRPSNLESEIHQWIHIVNGYRGGPYGFPSSHACNSFTVFTLVALVFRNKIVTLFFLLWACVHTYSRIYLGVHYPGDILTGITIGVIIASVTYYFFNKYCHLQEGVNTGPTQYKYEMAMPIIISLTLIAIVITSIFI